MKRDNDLILQILEWIESEKPETPLSSVPIHGYSDEMVSDHLVLMIEDNLLKGTMHHVAGEKRPLISVDGITSKGYDLLEQFWNEKIDLLLDSLSEHHNSRKLEDFIPGEGDLPADVIDSMHTIARLVKTGNSRKKQEAIGIFNQKRKDIPDDFAFEFIRAMWLDEDKEVKKNLPPQKLEELLINIERNFFPIQSIVEKYYDSLDQALKNVSNTVQVFDLSHSTARALKNSLSNPDISYPRNLITRFSQEHGEIVEKSPSSHQFGLHSSPIESMSDVIKSLPQEGADTGITPAFTTNEREIIRKQLDEIVFTDKDISFNVPGYELLFTLERMLRDLIQQRIMIPYKKDLASKIPADVITDMKTRKQVEESSTIVEGTYELIEYCDFTHLKKIFDKGRNWEFFRDIFTEEEMRGVYAKLGELDPIRKKIAHSRPLTRDEFERLRIYVSDIFKQMKKSRKYPG